MKHLLLPGAPFAFQYWWGLGHLLRKREKKKTGKGEKGKRERRKGEKEKKGKGEKEKRRKREKEEYGKEESKKGNMFGGD